MIIRQFVVMTIISLLLELNVNAMVGGTDLASLSARSAMVAVVTVTKVHSTNGVDIAEASVEHLIKGDETLKKVYFLASPTWTCDISRAKEGESALVFLRKINYRAQVQGDNWKLPMKGYDPLYRIGHAGRGRMPIYEKDEVKYTEVWVGDVKLPQGLKTFPSHRKPEYSFMADVMLDQMVLAATFEGPTYTFATNNNNSITIKKYTGTGGDITIPDSITGLPVTTIGYGAFYGYDSLINVTIPDSVTSIGSSAFGWCNCLTNITIPASVTTIENSAFHSCFSLMDVTIPDSVTTIGENAFYNCYSLTNVVVRNKDTTFEANAFSGCTNLIAIPISGTNNISGASFEDSLLFGQKNPEI